MRLYALAFLATVAGGCVRVDAKVTGITADAGTTSFPGAGAAGGSEMSVSNSFVLDNSNVSSLENDLKSASVQSVKLTPASGVTTLDFFRQLDIAIHVDGAPDLTLISAGADQLVPAADGTLTLPVNVGFDPATYLTKSVNVDATIDMMAPADDWSLGISLTLTVDGGTTLKI
ncbi:MAG TPA: hypothetical protein VIA18_23215 [Polyangia bacterium]|jgi:hypothetical protein|nr:hypothetical protein [Polyangia bacterium]HWE27599.1 hypothetical protein [Polyangia bacterium]